MKKRILSLLTALVCAASTGLSAFAAGADKNLAANITAQSFEMPIKDFRLYRTALKTGSPARR